MCVRAPGRFDHQGWRGGGCGSLNHRGRHAQARHKRWAYKANGNMRVACASHAAPAQGMQVHELSHIQGNAGEEPRPEASQSAVVLWVDVWNVFRGILLFHDWSAAKGPHGHVTGPLQGCRDVHLCDSPLQAGVCAGPPARPHCSLQPPPQRPQASASTRGVWRECKGPCDPGSSVSRHATGPGAKIVLQE